MGNISNVALKWFSMIILFIFALVLFFLTGLAVDSDNGGGIYPWISGFSAVCMLVYSYMIEKNKVNQKTAFKVSLWSILFVLVMLFTVPVASPELREQRKENQAKMELAKVKGETAVNQEKSSDWVLMLLFVALVCCIGYICFKVVRFINQTSSEMNSNEEDKSKASFWEQLFKASSKSFNKGLNFKPSQTSLARIIMKEHPTTETSYNNPQPPSNSNNHVEKRPEEKPKTSVDSFECPKPKEITIPVSCPKCGHPVMISVTENIMGGYGGYCPGCAAMISITISWHAGGVQVNSIHALGGGKRQV